MLFSHGVQGCDRLSPMRNPFAKPSSTYWTKHLSLIIRSLQLSTNNGDVIRVGSGRGIQGRHVSKHSKCSVYGYSVLIKLLCYQVLYSIWYKLAVRIIYIITNARIFLIVLIYYTWCCICSEGFRGAPHYMHCCTPFLFPLSCGARNSTRHPGAGTRTRTP